MPDPTPAALEASPSPAAPGPVATWLSQQGFAYETLGPDHLGVEVLGIEAEALPLVATALKAWGFDYLQCQGGIDEGPGGRLVSFYHLVRLASLAEKVGALAPGAPLASDLRPEEVRLKVSVARDGTPSIPSLYGLFHGADWQERETFDMFGIEYQGHPHPKRLLMPEDWKGWPLRKDYVQPDFYEMQDAY